MVLNIPIHAIPEFIRWGNQNKFEHLLQELHSVSSSSIGAFILSKENNMK